MTVSITCPKWNAAFWATFLISSFPNIFLYLVPVSWLSLNGGAVLHVQHIALAFASGGLLGDVLLHAIPHLMSPHDHSHVEVFEEGTVTKSEDAVNNFMLGVEYTSKKFRDDFGSCGHDSRSLIIGGLVLSGFLFFFITERILATYLDKRSRDCESKSEFITLRIDEIRNCNALTVKELKNICRTRDLPVSGKKSELVKRCLSSNPYPRQELGKEPDENRDDKLNGDPAFYEVLGASGWLNISADFMHNFTDGLAIGASHASGDGKLALAATISIFFHEVPHEIGDFAILIENGMSKKNAIRMQFLTSLGAFLGTTIGMLTASYRGWEDYLIAVTSGGFLYIASASLIPTILAKKENFTGHHALQITLEAAAFATGVGMMIVVSLLEGEGGHVH